jgi:DUF4097 and DUF4098 domain-containing protein YvlB
MTRDTATPATIEHRIGPTGQLSIKVADWDLVLAASPDDVARVLGADGQALPDDLEVERGTDSLSIRQPSRFPGVGFDLGAQAGGRRLAIEVPAHAAVNIESASGDIAANGLRGDQHLRTASGDLRLDAAAGDVTTETVSGDISVGVEGSVGLGVKTVSGDVSVEGGRVERLRLATTSGDVRLTSELGPGPHAIMTVSGDAILLSNRGLRITAVTVAGDLRSDLPHTSEGGPGRRSLVVGDGATELQFRSVSGDFRVMDPAAAGNGRIPAAPRSAASQQPPFNEHDEAEATRLIILRALESGEIDIAEATNRLATLDGDRDA